VLDDENRSPDGTPGLFAPYFSREPIIDANPGDYIRCRRPAHERNHLQLDPPAWRSRDQLDRCRDDARLAARARCGAVAHVRHSRQRRLGPLSLARQAVAAAGLLDFCEPPMTGVQEANCSLMTRSSRLASRSNSSVISTSRFSLISTVRTSRTSVKSATALTGRLSVSITSMRTCVL